VDHRPRAASRNGRDPRGVVRQAAAIRGGTLRLGEYQFPSAAVSARVRTILAMCKLPPAANAELHPILAALYVAANGMRGSQSTASAAAAREAVAALNRYGQIFDDPGWQPFELH
jgi:hypothetical protein